MIIKELSLEEFMDFANSHFIGNFHQSINYALIKAEEEYEYEFIGYVGDEIKAAALIIYKKIGNHFYGFSPRGFLIDYSNLILLENFTNKLKEYYQKRNFVFLRINPEIAISKLNKDTMNFEYNTNYTLINNLTKCGYKKLVDNMNFDALLPRTNAIVNLNNYSLKTLNKNTRNKIKKGIRKGLTLEKVSGDKINILYDFVKHKRDKSEYHYNNFYNVFSKSSSVDLFLIKINYKEFLINAQNIYNEELKRNNNLNAKLIKNNNTNIINAKMKSDIALLSYKNDISEASKNINLDIERYIAGALVIKYQNRIIIQISGYDVKYNRFAPNYYLHHALLSYYKKDFKYADLNGITADLSKDNYYYGLNRFKLGFNPDVYEYIGEYDLIMNDKLYTILMKKKNVRNEFNK